MRQVYMLMSLSLLTSDVSEYDVRMNEDITEHSNNK